MHKLARSHTLDLDGGGILAVQAPDRRFPKGHVRLLAQVRGDAGTGECALTRPAHVDLEASSRDETRYRTASVGSPGRRKGREESDQNRLVQVSGVSGSQSVGSGAI